MNIKLQNQSIGLLVVYNPNNGYILNFGDLDEQSGMIPTCLRPNTVGLLQLNYGDRTCYDSIGNCYVDINTKKVIVGAKCMPDQPAEQPQG